MISPSGQQLPIKIRFGSGQFFMGGVAIAAGLNGDLFLVSGNEVLKLERFPFSER